MEPVLCYESTNGSCLKTVYPLPLRITLYVILGITVILTVFGNLLVSASIAYFKQLHTPTNYLIMSLAVSDLLLGMLVMFPSMILSVETCWYFGDVFCKIFTSADVTLCTASILNLSFISVDRHYTICHPLLYRSKITVHVVVLMILISWSVSALIGFGMIFLELNILGMKEFYYTHTTVSSTLSSILSFYIPGIIMLGVYLKIFLVAQRQARRIQNISCNSSTKMSNTTQTKATKTLAIIMTPFFVCNIIDPFINYSTPPVLFETLVWLGYLNSTLNPLIYALFYSWFRKALRLFISGNLFKSDISETKLFTE
ncbi:hypothetical protein LDENG_00239270 [Lucifuga dentata]|nr:hypothetical protein LDENG_00239270 [Lucifuga dentata]